VTFKEKDEGGRVYHSLQRFTHLNGLMDIVHIE